MRVCFIGGMWGKNKKRLDAMINYSIKKGLSVYIVSTPLYETYRNHKSVLKDSYRKKYIDSLVTYSNHLAKHHLVVSLVH